MIFRRIFARFWLSALLAGNVVASEPDSRETASPAFELPPGFSLQIFARNLENPSDIAVPKNGLLYFTSPESGKVFALFDNDADGRADDKIVVAAELENVSGIAIHGGHLFLAGNSKLFSGPLSPDGRVEYLRQLRNDLPESALHPRRSIAFGPDDKLYISIGSSCNACFENNPERAALLRSNRDGSHREIVARGLRYTIGFDWHPVTGELWGIDNGTIPESGKPPPVELNRIEDENHYGWPFLLANGEPDPAVSPASGETDSAEPAKTAIPPALIHESKEIAVALAFYLGNQFPEPYRHDAFVAFRDATIRRLRFDEAGQPIEFENFLTSRHRPETANAAPKIADLAFGPDGSLYFSDDTHGVIYRLTYQPTSG